MNSTIASVAVTGEALAGSDHERHAGPPGRIHEELERHERLDVRVGADVVYFAIATVLTAHDVGLDERSDRLDQVRLGLAERVGRVKGGRIHRQQGHDLEHVILDDVADPRPSGRRRRHGPPTPKSSAIVIWTLVHVCAVPIRLEEALAKRK